MSTTTHRPIDADTLIAQFGGARRLAAMVGGFAVTAGDYVCIHFKGSRRMDRVVVRLNDSDLYDLEFMRYNKKTLECDTKVRTVGIYADDLVQVFEQETGLALRF